MEALDSDRDGHIAQHVRNRPHSSDDPINRQQEGDYLERQTNCGEHQRERNDPGLWHSRYSNSGNEAHKRSCYLLANGEMKAESLRDE
jgi:hypothetical protein